MLKLFWPTLLLLALAPTAFAFDLSDLEALLASHPRTKQPVDSIQELIPLLPAELRENYTFVYDSRSPFRTSISPQKPRVILFTADGSLLLTFTGDAEKPGFDLLEAMQFDRENSRFEPRAYVMPAAARRGETISAENRNCARCHGADPRPIFDSYPLWPGFYGSIQDSFPPKLPFGRREHSQYEKFLAHAAKSGVYKDLVYSKLTPVPPFLDPKLFSREKPEGDLRFFPFMPNTRLGMALTELNRKRVYRMLKSAPDFAKNEVRILAELLDCGPSMMNQAQIAPLRERIQMENQDRLVRLGVDPKDAAQRMNDMRELAQVRNLAQMEWAANTAGTTMNEWSMAMEPGSYSFFDGILSSRHRGRSFYLKEDLIHELLGGLCQRDEKFCAYFKPWPAYEKQGYPFGLRIHLATAKKACPLLMSKN